MVAVRSDSPIESITTKKLRERGILDTARAFGWQPSNYRNAVVEKYPVWDTNGKTIAHRITVFTDVDKKALGGSKYLWSPRKPESEYSNWYIHPHLKQSVANAGGVCYLANGEKSVLAFVAGGISNVIATTHTEIKVPDLSVLRELGVTTLVNIPDNDEAGRKGALKWQESVKDIAVVTLRWDTETPKYDANDLWIECGFDGELFRNTINNLPKLTLANVDAKPLIKQSEYIHYGDDLIDLIFVRLSSELGQSIQRPPKDTFTPNFKCMFHTHDENPSAGINDKGVINCFTCGKHSRDEVMEYLKIERPTRPTRTRHNAHLSPTDSVQRATLVQPAPQAKIISFDEAYTAYTDGLKGKAWLTTWDYMPRYLHTAFAIINTSDALLIRHIAHLIYTGDLSSNELKVSTIAPLVRFSEQTVRNLLTRYQGILWEKTVSKSGGGRPELTYITRPLYRVKLLSLVDERLRELLYDTNLAPMNDKMADDLIESESWLNTRYEWLKEEHEGTFDNMRDAFLYRLNQLFDELPDQPLPHFEGWESLDTTAYAKAYYEARILEAGEGGLQSSQKRLGLEMGVCDKTVSRYIKAINVKGEEQTKEVKLTLSSIPINQQVRDAERYQKGHAVSIKVYYQDALLKSFPYAGQVLTIKKAISEGKTVKIEIQQANRYTHIQYTNDELKDEEPMPKSKKTALKAPTQDTPTPADPTLPQVVKKGKTKKLWIPEIDDNPQRAISGHKTALITLRLANMTLDKECRAVAISTGRVIFDTVNLNTLRYVANNLMTLITDYEDLKDSPELIARKGGAYTYNSNDDIPF